MHSGLMPEIRAQDARALLDLYAAHPELTQTTLFRVLSDFRDKAYAQFIVAPDDQLAGFRGVLLAIHNLQSALVPKELQASIDRQQRKLDAKRS